MFLFEKSLIDTYCNRLYDLKERQEPFSCYGQIKANSAGKTLNVANINSKAAQQIVEHAYHQTALFFMGQNDHHLGDAINFNYVSSSPLTLLKITNGSLCHRSFFLNTSSLH